MVSFAYLNARVRNRRSQVLPESFFQQAMNQSFPEFVRALGDSIYGPDLVGDGLADVDRAVSSHLARTVADLPELVTGTEREAVALALLRADLTNLKAILRGKAAGQSPEEIKARLSGGTLPEVLVSAMLQAPDVPSVAQVLQLPTHPLAKALRAAAARTQDLLEIEVALDRDFFAYSLEKARRLGQAFLASYFMLEVDAINLSTAFKLQALGVQADPERYFVPGGSLVTPVLFSRVASGDLGALESLAGTPLGPAASARDLAALERGLRRALLDKALQGGRDTLGAGMALAYIRKKEWEAARVRLLARRAFYGLPVAAIEKEVFL